MADDKVSIDSDEGSILSTIRIRYMRLIVQAQAMILFLYGITRPSSPANLLWKLDPTLIVSTILSGTEIPFSSLVPPTIMVIAATILGRAFCGWICPLGFIQDMVSYGKKRNKLPDQFRLIKYTLLTGGLLIPILSGWTFLDLLSPMSLLTQSISSFFRRDFMLHPGILILLFAILLTVLTERRAWCRHVCPLGAALSLPSTSKTYKIRLDTNRCIKCMKCDEICTMGVCDIGKLSGLRYENECTLCMNCRDACPVNAIKPS